MTTDTPTPHPDRAGQTQPSGYTPPEVGAPTWPRLDDEGMYEVPGSRLRELRDAEAEVTRLRGELEQTRTILGRAEVELLTNHGRAGRALTYVTEAILVGLGRSAAER